MQSILGELPTAGHATASAKRNQELELRAEYHAEDTGADE
jgi:hypothetical protein